MNRQELVQLAQDPAIRSTMETADAAFVDVVLTVVNRALAHKNQIWLRDRNADLLRQLYAERSENKALAAVVSGLEDKVAALQLDLSLANDR